MQETSVSVKKTSTLLCVLLSWFSVSRKMPRPRPPRPPHLHSLPTSIAPSPAQKAWWVLQRPAAAPAAEEERHALSPRAGGRPLPQSPPPPPPPPPLLPRRGAGRGRVSSAAAPAAAYLERAVTPLPTLPERGGIKGGGGEGGKAFTVTPSLLRACGLGPVATCMDHRLAQGARLLALRIAPASIATEVLRPRAELRIACSRALCIMTRARVSGRKRRCDRRVDRQLALLTTQ